MHHNPTAHQHFHTLLESPVTDIALPIMQHHELHLCKNPYKLGVPSFSSSNAMLCSGMRWGPLHISRGQAGCRENDVNYCGSGVATHFIFLINAVYPSHAKGCARQQSYRSHHGVPTHCMTSQSHGTTSMYSKEVTHSNWVEQSSRIFKQPALFATNGTVGCYMDTSMHLIATILYAANHGHIFIPHTTYATSAAAGGIFISSIKTTSTYDLTK